MISPDVLYQSLFGNPLGFILLIIGIVIFDVIVVYKQINRSKII